MIDWMPDFNDLGGGGIEKLIWLVSSRRRRFIKLYLTAQPTKKRPVANEAVDPM